MKILDILGLVFSAAGAVILGIANMRHAEDSAKEAVENAFAACNDSDTDEE